MLTFSYSHDSEVEGTHHRGCACGPSGGWGGHKVTTLGMKQNESSIEHRELKAVQTTPLVSYWMVHPVRLMVFLLLLDLFLCWQGFVLTARDFVVSSAPWSRFQSWSHSNGMHE